uniref:Uncharacterized protein n=1 Tax=Anguilla anguilla TaxID=7936 RepID=A0A0E9UH80_ANGAN
MPFLVAAAKCSFSDTL